MVRRLAHARQWYVSELEYESIYHGLLAHQTPPVPVFKVFY